MGGLAGNEHESDATNSDLAAPQYRTPPDLTR